MPKERLVNFINLYTYSGKIAYPDGAPSILDIAVSLSREGRYAGAGVHWWPVALHTFVVCDLLPPPWRLHGLLHDAAECVLGDVPKPAKSKAVSRMEDEIHQRIYESLEIDWPSNEVWKAVHTADARALHGEVWSVGTRALRDVYPLDEEARQLVGEYYKKYSVNECVDASGPVVNEFVYRYGCYRGGVK